MTIQCPICESIVETLSYHGKIRSGSYGKMTDFPQEILKCDNCEVEFLSHFPTEIELNYLTDHYRQLYNDTNDIVALKKQHDSVHLKHLKYIDLSSLRDKKLLDVGAGPGCFLDMACGIAAKTYAIEPTQSFHPTLSQKHQVYTHLNDMIKTGERVDVATSFTVIEHVPHPIDFAIEMRQAVTPGGKVYITTPNSNHLLQYLNPEYYQPFNYRTAHLYYFNEKSLKMVFEKAGFSHIQVQYIQEYDISNLLYWMKDGRPTGFGKTDIFDEHINEIYQRYLEKKKLADLLLLTAIV